MGLIFWASFWAIKKPPSSKEKNSRAADGWLRVSPRAALRQGGGWSDCCGLGRGDVKRGLVRGGVLIDAGLERCVETVHFGLERSGVKEPKREQDDVVDAAAGVGDGGDDGGAGEQVLAYEL